MSQIQPSKDLWAPAEIEFNIFCKIIQIVDWLSILSRNLTHQVTWEVHKYYIYKRILRLFDMLSYFDTIGIMV